MKKSCQPFLPPFPIPIELCIFMDFLSFKTHLSYQYIHFRTGCLALTSHKWTTGTVLSRVRLSRKNGGFIIFISQYSLNYLHPTIFTHFVTSEGQVMFLSLGRVYFEKLMRIYIFVHSSFVSDLVDNVTQADVRHDLTNIFTIFTIAMIVTNYFYSDFANFCQQIWPLN